jgi:hypothetical protein
MIKQYIATAGRLIFALWYFGVGVLGLVLNDRAKDVANASTAFEKALAQTGFMNLLLCLACFLGGGALLLRRTAPLGIAILAPLVVIIFCFHLFITKDYLWGTANLLWLSVLAWRYRSGFDQLWSYAGPI